MATCPPGFTTNENAEMGISFAIIFISTIMVTAVVAGVIITTTNLMSQQAETTGIDVLAEISTGFSTIGVIGDRNADGNDSAGTSPSIQLIKVYLKLGAGSSSINMTDVLVEISNGEKKSNLVYNASGAGASDADANTYVVIAKMDDDDSVSGSSMVTDGDMVELLINTKHGAVDQMISENTLVSITIIPLRGTPLSIEFTTPDVFIGRFMEMY